jgi:hypothetical protein
MAKKREFMLFNAIDQRLVFNTLNIHPWIFGVNIHHYAIPLYCRVVFG